MRAEAAVNRSVASDDGGASGAPTSFVDIRWNGRPIALEYQWLGDATSTRPVVIFLHEGLGSVAMWKAFPARFCSEHGLRGLVFSRYGYGRSTPRPADEAWPPEFMHRQADEVLPLFFGALGIERPFLFGHSDGASIALLYASRFATAGVVAVAPHIFVEDISVESIAEARKTYETTDLKARLARYHADPESAFRGWNDAWLSPAFRHWNIESELDAIACPVLAVQGENDEYGTLEQVRGIVRRLPKTRLLVIPNCGHSPHRDEPALLSREAGRFILESTSST
jgi:pimeloyl-ACP methyl ester carboxylesterase